jgi:hypothetical protein
MILWPRDAFAPLYMLHIADAEPIEEHYIIGDGALSNKQ